MIYNNYVIEIIKINDKISFYTTSFSCSNSYGFVTNSIADYISQKINRKDNIQSVLNCIDYIDKNLTIDISLSNI